MDDPLRLPQHPRLGAFAGACVLAVPGSGTPPPAALDHLARCRQLLDARIRTQAATLKDDIAAMERQRPI
jgi:hypothetical protein